MTHELLQIIIECINKLIEFRSTLLITLAVAFVLAIGCWLACSYFTTLWNTRYQITKTHHILCAIAASITFSTVIIYQSLDYVRPIAEIIVQSWNIKLKINPTWTQKTFIKAYEAAETLGIEDFSNYPHPDKGGNTIPLSKDETQNKIATIYATEAIANFEKNHAYLSKILWAGSSPPKQAITKDVDDFFKTPPHKKTYPTQRAIELATRLISEELTRQIPQIVFLSRLLLIGFFFIIQLIPFSLIGWAAYRDLKETV